MNSGVEQPFAPTLRVRAVAGVLWDIGDQTCVAAIEVKVGASDLHPHLLGHLLQGVQPLRQQHHVGLIDRSHRDRGYDVAMMVEDGNNFLPLLVFVSRVANAIPPFLATVLSPLPRFQNRACAFPFTRLLSDAAPVMSTIQPTGLGDALSTLHTYLGQAGFMSYACLLVPLPSTPPLPRQPILGITPGLRFLGDPSS